MTVNQWIAVAALVGAAWLCRYQSLGAGGSAGFTYFRDRWTGSLYVAQFDEYRLVTRYGWDVVGEEPIKASPATAPTSPKTSWEMARDLSRPAQ